MDDLLNEQLGKKNYKRQHGEGFEVIGDVTGDDLHDLLGMGVDTLRQYGTAKYANDDSGFQAFRTRSIAYLDFVKSSNDNGGSITPTVESWCAFCGISRVTLMKYESRSEQWSEFIGYFKNLLMACKLELASKGKMPHVIYIFDATNNGANYFNTSEFKITTAPEQHKEMPKYEDASAIAEKYRARLTDMQTEKDIDLSKYDLETAKIMPD